MENWINITHFKAQVSGGEVLFTIHFSGVDEYSNVALYEAEGLDEEKVIVAAASGQGTISIQLEDAELIEAATEEDLECYEFNVFVEALGDDGEPSGNKDMLTVSLADIMDAGGTLEEAF